MSGKKISPELIQQIKKLSNEDTSNPMIAEKLGIHRDVVSKYRNRLKLTPYKQKGGKNPELAEKIRQLAAQNINNIDIAEELNIDRTTVRSYRRHFKIPEAIKPGVVGKKTGDFDGDAWLDWIETGQKLKKRSSWTGTTGPIKLGDGKEPIVLLQLGDTHIASWGTDHTMVRNVLKEIIETPNLYVCLMGDLIQMSIKLRSVIEVADNMMPPEQQVDFLEWMIEKILPKIAFSSWCNHGVEREEKQSGISHIKYLLNRKTAYFNGIGHPDLQVGKETYKVACSHRFRGNSMYDSTYGPKRYMRMEAPDREICLQADLHRPAFSHYYEGGTPRIAITNGTFQINSGYAQRYFSLRTSPAMPCLVLHNDKHLAVPFIGLDPALKYLGR